jgi:alkanesulfonate monooxygenase SsuD/methylene tetrahydromethanopterin reductase-like flavin-dependent oxidoreductase (luciferase family)
VYDRTVIVLRNGDTIATAPTPSEAADLLAEWYLHGDRDLELVSGYDIDEIVERATYLVVAGR